MLRARRLVALLCLLLVAGCGGNDDRSTAETTTAATTVATTQPPPVTAPRSMSTAESKAVLTRLLAEQGVSLGRTTNPDLLTSAWTAYRAFAGVEVDDPFLADPYEEEGDSLRFEPVTVLSEKYDETFQIRLIRRFKLNDFEGRFNRQQELELRLHFKATDLLASAQSGSLWSVEQAGSDHASQVAAWERAVESTDVFRAVLAEGKPVAVELTVGEGDIH